MNKKIINLQAKQLFPLEQLHKFIHQQNNQKRRIIPKNATLIQKNKTFLKNHSKSLYYYKSNNSTNSPLTINNGQVSNIKNHQLRRKFINNNQYDNQHQNRINLTINQQILCPQDKKPATQQCRSGRNINNGNQQKLKNILDTKNNRISLRSSSHYSKLVSVAGIPLNQKFGQDRKQNYLNTKENIRKNKYREIQKQNQRLAKRLDSKESQYSTKKLLKQYESTEKISKRLSQSKISQRSQKSDRSVSSQKSSRAHSSRNSERGSMKSTSRSNNNQKGFNKLQAKFQINKKVKIVEHNINKANQDQLNKFKSLFANSFSSSHKKQSSNYSAINYEKRMLRCNPYADVQVLSQKSQTSKTSSKSLSKNIVADSLMTSYSYKRLNKAQNLNTTNQKNKMSRSIMPQFGNLLHRIAQQMYIKESTTDILKDSPSNSKNYRQASSSNKVHRMLVDKKPTNTQASNKYSIYSINQTFKA